ncbi:MAG: AFG1/ZapE family ATPase [Nitrolancea sp.]
MTDVSIEQLRQRVAATRRPQFRLPKRFVGARFDNFVVDPQFSGQRQAIDKITTLINTPEPQPSRLPWRRTKDELGYRGVYLDGPPGIGKTHLLASAFQTAAEPKLFATFDEFSAAAGTLGMRRLKHLLGNQRLVCIDEIDLRDPGNIMLLTSLVRAMLEGRPRILATANADPTRMDSGHSYAEAFELELGEIASAFEIVKVDGFDWRESGSAAQYRGERDASDVRTVHFEDASLKAFLAETHPMYDAAWLDEVDRIDIEQLLPLADTDEALRFVRFVDRVYDRGVMLSTDRFGVSLDVLLAPVKNDRRFGLHYARCRSRLIELMEASSSTSLRIGS